MIYKRRALYHETDQMGIIHHSNYIKWFEEARIFLMREAGASYKVMEKEGILSPVLGINCDYKASVEFDDEVLIHVKVDSYNGIKMVVSYEITDPDEKIIYVTGSSKHCFIDGNKRIVSMKKRMPEFHSLLAALL